MKTAKKIGFILLLGLIFEGVMFLIIYQNANWAVGAMIFFGVPIGIPLSAAIIGVFTVIVGRYIFKLDINAALLVVGIGFVLAEGSFISSIPYLAHLSYARSDYESAQSGFIFGIGNKDQGAYKVQKAKEIVKEVQFILPKNWVVSTAEYEETTNTLWFTVLEPSFLYGSQPHFGFYRPDTKSFSELLTVDQVWAKVVEKAGLPSTQKYDRAPRRMSEEQIVEFEMEDDSSYMAKLTDSNSEIVIQEVQHHVPKILN